MMLAGRGTPRNIDEYITSFPPDVGAILEKIRLTIRKAAPAAQETISYKMPTFTLSGTLVHFAAFKKHIGFYPPVHEKSLKPLVARYAGPKGNLQFPLCEPIPHALIARIVKARVRERRKSG